MMYLVNSCCPYWKEVINEELLDKFKDEIAEQKANNVSYGTMNGDNEIKGKQLMCI